MLKPNDFSSMGSAEIFCDFFRFLPLPLRLKNIPLDGASFLAFFLTIFFFDPAFAAVAFPASLPDVLPLVDFFAGFFEAAVFWATFFFVAFFFFGFFLPDLEKRSVKKSKKPMMHHWMNV
ncbi:hypothetical protein [uncultured Pseudodesulfovibrio sp.]|uniref:hypothetical protein n=1 Tax=uncultured Pseudodesulfovibrio sp. TaxID=2035858 RepID=UPI0029C983F1|nr:hypothetical protein [uncultured Pseudodesulfovibrio sp.]